MQLWNVGDKSEAICPACRKRITTTFEIRDMRVADRGVMVRDVLVAVCDNCDEIAAIPAQSAPLLKQALEKEPAKVAARINRRLEDAVRLMATHFGTRDREFRALLIRFYLSELSRSDVLAKRIAKLAHSDLVKGTKTGRLEVRLPEAALDAAWEVARQAGMRSHTEMIEGVIAAATEDILEDRAPKRAAQLEALAAFA